MAANAMMIWRAFRSSNHPAARFAREVSWSLIGQAAILSAAIVVAIIVVRSVA